MPGQDEGRGTGIGEHEHPGCWMGASILLQVMLGGGWYGGREEMCS